MWLRFAQWVCPRSQQAWPQLPCVPKAAVKSRWFGKGGVDLAGHTRGYGLLQETSTCSGKGAF